MTRLDSKRREKAGTGVRTLSSTKPVLPRSLFSENRCAVTSYIFIEYYMHTVSLLRRCCETLSVSRMTSRHIVEELVALPLNRIRQSDTSSSVFSLVSSRTPKPAYRCWRVN